MVKIILLAAASGAGKTTIARHLVENFWGTERAVLISADDFYREHLEHFDTPQSFDFPKLAATVARLKNGKAAEVAPYDFVKHEHGAPQKIPERELVLVEGLLVLSEPKLRALADAMIFVDVDSGVSLARRLLRDEERLRRSGETLRDQLERWLQEVWPTQRRWIVPSRQYADIVVENNDELPDCLAALEKKLRTRGLE